MVPSADRGAGVRGEGEGEEPPGAHLLEARHLIPRRAGGRGREAPILVAASLTSMPSVLVAMSGGVDSSVSACLLAEQGYDVLGSHMKLVHLDGVDHGCCGPRAEADAREVARIGGFDFEVADVSAAFGETVLADFFGEHEAGRTPNPCVRC